MIRAGVLAGVLAVAAACGGGTGGVDATVELGPITVTGRVEYEDRAPLLNGTLGPATPAPARFVAVALVDLAGATLGEAVTADDGTFEISSTVDVPYGDSLHILAATTSADAARPVEVVRTDGNVHGFGGAGFEARATVNTDLLVSETSNEAGAFNVFDQLVDAVDRVTALGRTPPSLTAIWSRGNPDGTYYNSGTRTMHLLGGPADDDGYDDQVILHEAGHYIEYALGRSDSPGGFHDGTPTDPNLAWSEGFATYWAMAVTNAPIYIDTAMGGGWSFNADSSSTPLAAGSTATSNVSEDTVVEVLWDLGDAGGSDDDALDGEHDQVLLVQPEYLRTAALATDGEPGVDLFDFLDGFFVADGLTRCAQIEGVTAARLYPYDFDGPAGACP